MAKALFTKAANPTPKINKGVVLELTAEEAAVLIALGEVVGGKPDGPRGVFDRVSDALAELYQLDCDDQAKLGKKFFDGRYLYIVDQWPSVPGVL